MSTPSINNVKAEKFMESEMKRHNEEVKKLRAENFRAYESEVKNGEKELSRIKGDYEGRISNLKNETEQRLTEIRDRQ